MRVDKSNEILPQVVDQVLNHDLDIARDGRLCTPFDVCDSSWVVYGYSNSLDYVDCP